ncbi:MAG TPA: carboxypeptidase regulatory-like domain-containing protein [Candidatus Sulfotelmatobacter sp.]|nr:carboxypeptidase regulatory-like domain-containing protein [Candidatus Sulfotelmatobacter sp.]
MAVAMLALSGMLRAQSATEGAVSGTVADASNAVVADTTVTLKSLDKGYSRQTTTNAQGIYQFPLTDPGNYEVVVAATGFKQFAGKASVNVGQVTVVNVKLEVGAAGTTVEVSAAPPLLDTQAADMSTSFDRNLVENLPNGGNDLTAVAYTAPGVVMNSGGMYGNFTANGLPATSNVFTVDGENQMDPFLNLNNSGPTNLMLGKNSIDEATVITNAYSGQYGQQAGAQVSMVSKGGTNNYHGNVQYQWTGRLLDANDWFNTFFQPAQPRPFANNNQWAASFGGPIKKDKTFFFIDTEGIRYIVPSTTTVYTPTTAFLNDTMNIGLPGASASANTIATYKKAAGIWEAAPGFGNGTALPGTCGDPLTGGTIDGGPTATAAGSCIQSYSASPALPAKETLLIGRFDQNFGVKDRLFFRFDIDTGTQATYADPIDSKAFSAASYQPEYNNSLNWSHTFNGTATNQFIAAISYYRAIFVENTSAATSPFPYAMYLGTTVGVSSPFGLPSATGLNALNYAFPSGRNVTQWQLVDDFAKTMGRHSVKAGVNFRRYDLTNYDASQLTTPLVYAGLNDFFTGNASIYAQNNPLHPTAPMNTGGFGVYGQDEWSVLPRLKLTFALRAEHNFNPTCDTNCFTLPNAPFYRIKTQGIDTPYNKALLTGRKDAFGSVDSINWAPRFGFTWSPRDNSRTVVSGGFGIFYDAFPGFITDSFVSVPYLVGVNLFGPDITGAGSVAWGDSAGAAATVASTVSTIRNGNAALGIPSLANGLTMKQLLAAGGAQPNITGFPGTLRTPQYQEWNFQVQQAIGSKDRITVAYVGNHGYHEPYPNSTLNANVNPINPVTNINPKIANYPTSTPDSRFGTFTEWNSGAVSNNNELTATYTRRISAGFVVNVNYTWAHTLDEISNGSLLPSGTSAIQGQINPLSLRANNYGNADYDIRHSLNANYVWTEPFHFNNRMLGGLLGGWMLSENFITRTGLPYTVTDGTTSITNGGTATPAQLVNLNAQQSCTNGNSQCFNSAAFTSANGLGFFPTQLRNQFRGPGFFDSDFTVGKNFHATERVKITVGANIYNIFNHPNFQNPGHNWTGATCSTPVGSAQQGNCANVATQAAPPTGPYGSFFQGLPAGREGQLQAKIVF